MPNLLDRALLGLDGVWEPPPEVNDRIEIEIPGDPVNPDIPLSRIEMIVLDRDGPDLEGATGDVVLTYRVQATNIPSNIIRQISDDTIILQPTVDNQVEPRLTLRGQLSFMAAPGFDAGDPPTAQLCWEEPQGHGVDGIERCLTVNYGIFWRTHEDSEAPLAGGGARKSRRRRRRGRGRSRSRRRSRCRRGRLTVKRFIDQ